MSNVDPNPITSGDYAQCPWCGHKIGDTWDWVDMGDHRITETECDECEGEFFVTCLVSLSLESTRIEAKDE